MPEEILQYLRSKEDKLQAGAPLLSRAERKALKGLPPWSEVRKLARA